MNDAFFDYSRFPNLGKLQEPYNGSRQKPTLIDGNYTYVIDAEGNLQMAKSSKLGMDGGHTSLSGEKPVKYAGTMKFNGNGQLESWTNGSGHYEPNASQAPEISKIFESIGIPGAKMGNFIPVIPETSGGK